jgi:hypothetical protein
MNGALGGIGPMMFQIHSWFWRLEVKTRTESDSKASRPGWEGACGSGD